MEGNGSQDTSTNPTDPQYDQGKMFIGGLSWQTSPDSLKHYFNTFGEIRECMVMRDPTTKRSRCFGFVTFSDSASVDNVLAQPHHELDSKMVSPPLSFTLHDTMHHHFSSLICKHALNMHLCIRAIQKNLEIVTFS
ncbi:RNA-binding protein Musashi homolog 2-like [Hippocampus zosterae]|uniref:RNA-binding protein Musashi homolog 2-like n=1 Tax=Hippocampus zosterae TaxID=109293 RepID=UPI00223D95B3|nr:RNA-binding protein Musashi homolog 2-like [Hippocampus zosterae]